MGQEWSPIESPFFSISTPFSCESSRLQRGCRPRKEWLLYSKKQQPHFFGVQFRPSDQMPYVVASEFVKEHTSTLGRHFISSDLSTLLVTEIPFNCHTSSQHFLYFQSLYSTGVCVAFAPSSALFTSFSVSLYAVSESLQQVRIVDASLERYFHVIDLQGCGCCSVESDSSRIVVSASVTTERTTVPWRASSTSCGVLVPRTPPISASRTTTRIKFLCRSLEEVCHCPESPSSTPTRMSQICGRCCLGTPVSSCIPSMTNF